MSRNQRFRDKAVREYWQREVELGRRPSLPTRLPVGWATSEARWKLEGGGCLPLPARWGLMCVIQEACRTGRVDGVVSERLIAEALSDLGEPLGGQVFDLLVEHGYLQREHDESRRYWIWNFDECLPSKKEIRPEIPDVIRAAVLNRDGRRCLRCGATENLTIDHIHPWAHGGEHNISNFQLLCRSCNSKKGARIEPVEPEPPCAAVVKQQDRGQR